MMIQKAFSYLKQLNFSTDKQCDALNYNPYAEKITFDHVQWPNGI